MKKIAVINDLSGLGKCSLTASIPAISAMGVQAVPLPTAILSNQTGFPSYFLDDYTDRMTAIMDEWEKRDFQPDGIYTGFLAGEAQAEKITDFFRRFCKPETLVLVDPVMGDRGEAYSIFTDALLENMRRLCTHANVITPNLTEALLLLYGKQEMEKRYQILDQGPGEDSMKAIEELGEALKDQYGLDAAVITGIDYKKKDGSLDMGNFVAENGNVSWIFAPKTGGSYSGTGDLFASVLSAGLVRGMSMVPCAEKAVRFLSKAIRDAAEEGCDRNEGVCFETYLHELWEE